MVPPYQRDPIRVPDFQAEQQQEALQRVEPPVHEVAHEQIVRIWDISPNPKQLHEVMELSVNVPAYGNWRIDLDDIAFLDEQLSRLEAQFADLWFWDRSAGAQF